MHLIPLEGIIEMENNPFITVTGTITSFDADEHTFTISPTQYIVLGRTSLPFPIHAHFANSSSTKRWGSEGLVSGSPVRSGFSAKFRRTATATGCLLWQDPK